MLGQDEGTLFPHVRVVFITKANRYLKIARALSETKNCRLLYFSRNAEPIHKRLYLNWSLKRDYTTAWTHKISRKIVASANEPQQRTGFKTLTAPGNAFLFDVFVCRTVTNFFSLVRIVVHSVELSY
jgi:hypothetical protein